MKPSIQIAPATERDLPQILAFIRGLAEYEKLSAQCVASEESLRKTLFGPRPYADVLIARLDDAPVGFTLFELCDGRVTRRTNLFEEIQKLLQPGFHRSAAT